MNEVCKVCGQPLEMSGARICLSCRYVVHADCIIRGSAVCQDCWLAGQGCRETTCFAYSAGMCLTIRCLGVVHANTMEEKLNIRREAYSLAERSHLYRQLHRQFYSFDGALERIEQREICPHTECLAYEKTVCLASLCFGSITLPRIQPVMVRAKVYDDFVLRPIAKPVPGTWKYAMHCRKCGEEIICSGDAARHFMYYRKTPLCSRCAKADRSTT